MSKAASMGEFDLIEKLKRFQNLSASVVKGIGDDAAILTLDAKRYQLLTTDMLVEDVHFTRRMPARLVGRKSLACSISDIAAMGGLPTAAVVSIGVPRSAVSASYIQELYAGMAALAKKFGVSLVGGDTVRSDKFVINVALLGVVEKRSCVTRTGARPGDIIFVTGPLGNSLKSGRHLSFMPRVQEARFLAEHFKPSAMMDISDGLAGDLGHILEAGKVGAVLDEAGIPLAPGASIDQALHDGEDFELLFTLSFRNAQKLLQYPKLRKVGRFIPVGGITASKGLVLCHADGTQRAIEPRGFRHF